MFENLKKESVHFITINQNKKKRRVFYANFSNQNSFAIHRQVNNIMTLANKKKVAGTRSIKANQIKMAPIWQLATRLQSSTSSFCFDNLFNTKYFISLFCVFLQFPDCFPISLTRFVCDHFRLLVFINLIWTCFCFLAVVFGFVKTKTILSCSFHQNIRQEVLNQVD